MSCLKIIRLDIIGLCFMVFTAGSALLMDPTFEGSCNELENVTLSSVNMNWFNSVPTWYLSAGSVHHLYSTSLHFFGDDKAVLEAIPEYRFYYEACLTMENHGGQATLRGYDPGRMTFHNISMAEDGAIDYIHLREDGGVSDISRVYITLTDNQSFVFLTSCELYANYKGWGVVTTTQELSPDAKRRIEEHATAQGFDKNLFAFMRYDSCQPGVVLNSTSGIATGQITNMNTMGQNGWASKGRGSGGRLNKRW